MVSRSLKLDRIKSLSIYTFSPNLTSIGEILLKWSCTQKKSEAITYKWTYSFSSIYVLSYHILEWFFISDYLNIEMADVPSCVVIRFVIPRGKTEVTVTQAMALAYEKSKEAGLSSICIQEQEMLNKKAHQGWCVGSGSIFWASPNHVINFPCSVLGPRYVQCRVLRLGED